MDGQTKSLRVLMVPWLAHGHLSPFLELSKKLMNRNMFIYFCSTPINLNTIKNKLDKYTNSIELVELHLPSLPDLPPHLHTTNGLPPHLIPTLHKAFSLSKPNLSNIIKNLKPDIVIYDASQPWLDALTLSLDIPCVPFSIFCAAVLSFFSHLIQNHPGVEYPHPAIFIREYEKAMFSQIIYNISSSSNADENGDIESPLRESCKVLLFKSFEEIEGKYFNTLATSCNKKVIPVGPLVEEVGDGNDDNENLDIMEWLNKKEPCSSVFVCFGSEHFLSKEDMEEIAHGLELSNVNFIWPIRFPKGEMTTVQEALPQGFQERVGNRGMILEGWAPQARILKHASVGAFISHCGWSSVVESMKYGVAIVAIPMKVDQPLNARLVEEIGAGMEIVRDSQGTLQREKVAKVIREVLVEEKGGNARKKARELSECIKNKGEEEMDMVVKELLQICGKSK